MLARLITGKLQLQKSHKVSSLSTRKKKIFIATHPVECRKEQNYSKQVTQSSLKLEWHPCIISREMSTCQQVIRQLLLIKKTVPHNFEIFQEENTNTSTNQEKTLGNQKKKTTSKGLYNCKKLLKWNPYLQL